MTHAALESDAFRIAELRSERLRTGALIGMGGVFIVVVVVRTLAFGDAAQQAALPAVLALLAVFVLFETWMLRRVAGALDAAASAPALGTATWRIKVIVEALVPTAAILVATSASPGPYLALTSPALGVYYVFIILATLRLDRRDVMIAGAVAAAGYLAAVLVTYQLFPDHPARVTTDPTLLATHAVLLLIAGWTAGHVAQQIRGHIGVALREARQSERMGRDLEVARSIQQGLLPQEVPSVEGYEIAGWNDPADETGGDYFDWVGLADGRVVITLADVTGHGIGSALVAAVCRAYGRANLPFGMELPAAMARINAVLTQDLPRGKLVQLVAAVVAPGGNVDMLSAGHGPLLVYRAGARTFERHNAHGIPLGVMAAFGYGAAQRVDLAPGDMLVLFTDGFNEWENALGEQYGLDRLEAAIHENAALPPREIIAAMHAGVLGFAPGTPQADDLTAVIVKRVG